MPYTDAHKIGDYLGRSLTAQEFAQATQLVGPVEAYIDRCTGRAWLMASPVTDEIHRSVGPWVYLTQRPVLAITSVKVRATPTGTDTTLAATDYALVDGTNGQLWVADAYYGYVYHWGYDYLMRVTYTHAGPALPADLALAATMLGAHWLQSHIDGTSGVGPGIKSYSVGQELSVTYADSSESGAAAEYGIPDNAKRIIDAYRSVSKVFA